MIPPPLRAFLYVVEERLGLGIFDGGAGGSKGASTSEGRKLQLVDWNVWHEVPFPQKRNTFRKT